MNTLTITDGNNCFELQLNQVKYLLGKNTQKKHELIQMLKLYFNPAKSEYREENNLKTKVLIDNQELNLKRSMLFIVNNEFSLNEECKLGTRSNLSKYFEAKLGLTDYWETINTIDILFESLAEELNEDDEFQVEFNSMNTKQLIKLMNPYYYDEYQKDEYDFSIEELTLLQLKLINYIQRKNKSIENYIVIIDSGLITKSILDYCSNLTNSFVLISTSYLNDEFDLNQIALFEDIVLDLANFDLVYEYFGEQTGKLLTCQEVEMKLYKYIKEKYAKQKVELINDIQHFSY
ncbi:hypothetical protein [Floccifex sp.]|uniref:hypothetical protein n=1 Tax=Floccifex sp. TaxID=2815810 RepID=UPI003F080C85